MLIEYVPAPYVALAIAGLLIALLGARRSGLSLSIGTSWQNHTRRSRPTRQQLRKLTPGFVSYVRIGLAGYDAPAALLERYIALPNRRLAALQTLVAEALELMHTARLRPFEALRRVARDAGCSELSDVAEALAQAEAGGGDSRAALASQEQTLRILLEDEFRRSLKRRTLYLLLLVAIGLVIGILGNLLFVFVFGQIYSW